jgi:hypothetical protein
MPWLLEVFECCREWLDGVRLGKPGVCFAEKTDGLKRDEEVDYSDVCKDNPSTLIQINSGRITRKT